MENRKRVWVCDKCPQEVTVYVNLTEAPTHHCPSIKSSNIKPFHLKGETNE